MFHSSENERQALWTDPPDISMANARDEAEMVMFPVVEAALKKTGDAQWKLPKTLKNVFVFIYVYVIF